jgi:transposase
VLAVSLELAAAKWKVALHDGHRESPSIHTVAQTDPAARLEAVLALIATQKQAWALPDYTRVVVSYEAGQDAFWIFRALQARGIECYVVDPASIPVQRQKRRAKTDRLDVTKLVINLRAWLGGERDRMHAVHVPSAQDEASRHLMRERGQLQKEVLQHRDRMRKLLATVGCWEDVNSRQFAARIARREVRCHDGAALPEELHERLLRECERLALVEKQAAALEKAYQLRLPERARERIDHLTHLRGIGPVSGSRLALELFWRRAFQGIERAVNALSLSDCGVLDAQLEQLEHLESRAPGASHIARTDGIVTTRRQPLPTVRKNSPKPILFTNLRPMRATYFGEQNGAYFGSKVIYLDKTERQAHKIRVINGLILNRSGAPFDTKAERSAFSVHEGHAIFVMDKYGDIYISNHEAAGKIHHSSFMAGRPVAAAGEIRIEQGVVKLVSPLSGHYHPTRAQLDQFIQRLRDLGVKAEFEIDGSLLES